MPPIRNVNAQFLKQVFRGDKKILKKSDMKPLGKIFGFKSLSTERIVNQFPDPVIARQYLPDLNDYSKLDRTFVLTVH